MKISKNSSNKKVLLDWDNNFSFRWPYSKSPSLRRYPDPKLNFPYLITEERSIFPLQLWNNAQELELKTHLFINGVENWKKLYNLSPVREMWHKCFWAPGLLRSQLWYAVIDKRLIKMFSYFGKFISNNYRMRKDRKYISICKIKYNYFLSLLLGDCYVGSRYAQDI